MALAHPRNLDVLTGLQAAREWRVRPLEFFGVEGQGAWTDDDRALTLALTLYERSLCADCGQPSRVAYDPEMDGWYAIDDTTICYACAARERYVHEMKDPEPGLKLRIINEHTTE